MKHYVLILLMFSFPPVFAHEQIPITISGTMGDVDFDGKWTFMTEWKQSSLNEYRYGDDIIILRSAHQGEFVYLFIDAITDYTIDSGLDSAVVCFDTNNDKNEFPNEDDYCFVTKLDGGMGKIYSGNSDTQNFTEITTGGFIAIGTVSDINDRYSSIPHTGYEFKIPTEIIGRNNIYGFYFAVYEANSQKYYTYPQNITTNTIMTSPSLWGEIYSPDKSLPEFSLPILLLLPALGLALFLTKYKLGNIS